MHPNPKQLTSIKQKYNTPIKLVEDYISVGSKSLIKELGTEELVLRSLDTDVIKEKLGSDVNLISPGDDTGVLPLFDLELVPKNNSTLNYSDTSVAKDICLSHIKSALTSKKKKRVASGEFVFTSKINSVDDWNTFPSIVREVDGSIAVIMKSSGKVEVIDEYGEDVTNDYNIGSIKRSKHSTLTLIADNNGVFDILFKDGKDLHNLSLEDRVKHLKGLNGISLDIGVEVASKEELGKFNGQILIRDKNSPYYIDNKEHGNDVMYKNLDYIDVEVINREKNEDGKYVYKTKLSDGTIISTPVTTINVEPGEHIGVGIKHCNITYSDDGYNVDIICDGVKKDSTISNISRIDESKVSIKNYNSNWPKQSKSKYILQRKWVGRESYTNLYINNGVGLTTWTFLTGKSSDPVDTVKDAMDKDSDINVISGEVMPKPKKSSDWLDVEGVIPSKSGNQIVYKCDEGTCSQGVMEDGLCEYFFDGNVLKGNYVFTRKVYLGEFREEGSTHLSEDPKKYWKELLHELRILGNSAMPKLEDGGEWGDWSKEEVLKYFADVVDSLRSVYFPIKPPSENEEGYDTSYWKVYRKAQQYMDSSPPSEDEISDWEERRDETISKGTIGSPYWEISELDTPIVLQNKEFLPPKGFSCLPEAKEEEVPLKYKYWRMVNRDNAESAKKEITKLLLEDEFTTDSMLPDNIDIWVEPFLSLNTNKKGSTIKCAVDNPIVKDIKDLTDKDIDILMDRDWSRKEAANKLNPSTKLDKVWKWCLKNDKHRNFVEEVKKYDVVNKSWEDMIDEFDSKDTFFYVTPNISILEVRKKLKSIEGKYLIETNKIAKAKKAFDDVEVMYTKEGKKAFIYNYGPDDKSTVKFDVIYKSEDEQIVGGVVYESYTYDADGEWAKDDTVREAMYYWMEEGMEFSIGHQKEISASVLECFQAEEDTIKGNGVVPAGTWYVAARIKNDQAWELVRSGELRGWSWEGKVIRERNRPIT